MAEHGSGAPGGYVAFVSYSHRDAAVGRWLHRRLESYRLPRRLAGTQGEDGEVPGRLTPIFRDRDELPAAGDLSERVCAALALSRNLIVICSPHSAASPWVAKEIATFRELHPDRPIFTAIAEGEPDQCFPPVLRDGGVEPLAADLRKEGDGRRLGLLKLVAGLAGVGLDSLVQRDAARRVRRVSWISGAAVAGMLLLAMLTLFAVKAQAEAERQRQEAEGLVEFMLTDLRDSLKGVGRVDVLTIVNQRALRRYQNVDLNALPADALLRRARILHVLGEDEVTAGRMESAFAAFREARKVTSEQLARAPDDPQRLFEHAKSEYWIGRVHELRREWPAAQRQYGSFAAAMERLIARAPANPDYMTEFASSAIDLGNVRLNGFDDAAGAQAFYERAVAWFGRAARVRPDQATLRSQANAYAWLADSFYARGLWSQSLAARLKQHSITARLRAANPADAQNEFRLAAAERGLARSLAKVGQSDESRATFFSAYRRSQKLDDRNNAEWRLFRAAMGCELYFGKLGIDSRVKAQLRDEVKSAAARLAADRDPRLAELRNCLAALKITA